MKKQFLLLLACLLSAATLRAADVSVTEKFTQVKKQGDINTSTTAGGLVRSGDVCNWNFSKLRYNTDVITVGSTNYTAVWLNKNSDSEYSELATTNLEGGIKTVSFRWAQFAKETGNTLKLKVVAGAIEHNPAITRDGNSGSDSSTGGSEYSHSFECKTNGQLVITNVSDKVGNACRILVCNICITPYILYRNKDVTVGLKQRGYANDGKQDFINNTGSEGSIAFSSSNENVATVDPETGVVTPVGVGDAIITATWSEGASTTYTLHVVNGIIAENFSKVVQTGQTTDATWHGDLFDWKVANVRRGEADTLGLSPRIQATAMRTNTGSTIISANSIEGGVKHLAFDWRQWASATSPLTFKAYYSTDKENWGDAVATQEVEAATASTPHVFDADIDNGSTGNAYLKLEYTSGTGVAVIGALKITPYLLYTTKEATLDTRVSTTYTNTGLINNTGEAVVYSIAPAESGATINAATGQVTATDETEGTFTITATWGEVSTTYTLTIASRAATTATFANAAMRLDLGADVPANTLTKTAGYDGTVAYSSSNTAVATVAADGTVTLAGGVGQTTITATLPQTGNYRATEASYIIYVRDNGARKEAFKGLTQSGVVGNSLTDLNAGDLFAWQAQYQVRRGTNDTIWNTSTKGISIGINTSPSAPSILQSKEVVEGGIKHLSFYWKQWANNSDKTLRMSIYVGSTCMAFDEHASTATPTYEKYLLGANAVMKSNQQLVIKNESYTGESFATGTLATDAARIIIDTIYITPYLLYTDKSRHTMRIGNTYTREIINNTAGESGTLSYTSSNEAVATVNGSGQVTAVASGRTTITAKFAWSVSEFVTTTYEVEVVPANCETFSLNETSHTYAVSAEESAEEDMCSWFTWLGGIKQSNFDPYVAIIRAPRTNEEGPAYLQSGTLSGGVASMTFNWNIVDNEPDISNWDIRIFINGREVKRLGDADLTKTKMAEFASITINDINEPDNFTIRFENHSTISGEYTSGNKARFVIDNISWTSYAGTKTLAEDTDNSGWIRSNGGQTRSVTISRSALRGGVWNTLCLPFDISKSTNLDNAEVQEMTSASLSGDELTISFTAFTGETLEAGIPYLVKPASDIDISDTYSDKQITSIASAVNYGAVTLQGIYSPTPLKANDYSTLFVGTPDSEGNNLFYPSEDGSLKGFRAYFKISEAAAGAPIRHTRFVTNQTDAATGVVSNQQSAVSGKQIENGQLIIIREGQRYDVLGRKK